LTSGLIPFLVIDWDGGVGSRYASNPFILEKGRRWCLSVVPSDSGLGVEHESAGIGSDWEMLAETFTR
jgi:hypothetical protein